MRVLRPLGQFAARWRDVLLGGTAVCGLIVLIGWFVVNALAYKALAHKQLTAVDPGLFVPEEARCVVAIRVADMLNSDFGKNWVDAMPRELDGFASNARSKNGFVQAFDENFAVNAYDIESWVVATNRAPLSLEVLMPHITTRLAGYDSPLRPGANYFNDYGYGKGTNGKESWKSTATGYYSTTGKTAKESAKETAKATAKKADQSVPPNGGVQSTKASFPDTKASFPTESSKFDRKDGPLVVDKELRSYPVSIITTTKPGTLDKARSEAAQRLNTQYFMGRKLYVAYPYEPRAAVFFPDARTMVVGSARLIQRAIAQQDAGVKPGTRLDTVRKHSDRHVVIDCKYQGSSTGFGGGEEEMLADYRPLAPLAAAKGKLSLIDLDKEFSIEARYDFDAAVKAQKAVPAIKDWLNVERILVLGRLQAALDLALPQATDEKHDEAITISLLFFEQLENAYREPNIKLDGNNLTVTLRAKADFKALGREAREAVKTRWTEEKAVMLKNSKKSQANLKEIGMALHNYHDQNKRLPPWASCDKNGKPQLSWRVFLLPYIEEVGLYRQFNLDEPWDSAHNIKLLDKMPAIYAAPGIKTAKPGLTHYQGFVGPGAGWEHLPDASVQNLHAKGAKGLPLSLFFDGLSNTIAVIEAGESVPWTKPADLPFAKGQPLPKIGGLYGDKANVLMFDASVRSIPLTFRQATLEAAITRGGGEVIPDEWYR
jgi:hypothetical protein